MPVRAPEAASRRVVRARSPSFLRLALGGFLVLVLLALAAGAGGWLLLRASHRSRSHRVRRLPPPKRLHANSQSPLAPNKCAPEVLDARAMPLHSDSSAPFYTELVRLAPTLPAPEFEGDHAFLCEEHLARREQWANCLPISGRLDEPFCSHASRDDLLWTEVLPGQRDRICHASVLHLILVDVYEELEALGAKPVLLYGTLLGAVRNQSLMAYTEDADLGFQDPSEPVPDADADNGIAERRWMPLHSQTMDVEVADALWRKGYHLFHYGIYRVCVAPSHPLGSRLYDPRKPLGVEYAAPYVDLYRMFRHIFTSKWDVEQSRLSRKVPDAKVQPFAQVGLLGRRFATLADPIDFLQHEYGEESYLIPESWPWTK